jgi:GTP-binding protein
VSAQGNVCGERSHASHPDEAFGNPAEVMKVVDIPDVGSPGEGEVVIALEASPINMSDLLMISGRYGYRPKLPSVMGTEGVGRVIAELRETCERLLPQIKGVAFVPVSALTGKGIDKLLGAVLAADALWNKRLPTHALNQWLREAVETHSPPAVSGRRIKLRYITESNARPPTFVLFCSRPKALPDSYVRYLVNSLRETFDLPGVPIRLHLRKGENPYAKGE